MECEAAFKTSSRMDAGLKFSPRAFLEELSASNVQNLTPSDQFFVDGLLDFSHHDALPEQPDQPQQPLHDSLPVSPRLLNKTPKTSSVTDDFASAQLILPADEEADLEWLSHFVEDSFFEYSAPYPAGTLPGIPKTETEKVLEFETPVAASPCFPTPVPAKARSKRTRTGLRLIGFEAKSPSVNKLKRRTADEAAEGVAASTPRKCSHCGVQKTPQWRTGPLGAKTLCNACGVRYKSGRLLPEYRPACSPTFSSELHSNHHRKVLEMRREKEMSEMGSGLEPPTVVPSF
ncbi:GATA transcription factor 5 isoform X2 [Neltuma alba]|uniref:GATA transcription factor 5 isoform X2 n=1 Tax=Neltuma alba TaxID=207710 RepID=UPI0010A2BA1A|nr:GATA transcription factor 5-like isoform X2 [Prosopis alba]